MTKLLRWIFWNIAYMFRRRPKEFAAFLLWGSRCYWQRKFRPYLWHNDDGSQWQVYFTEERDYVQLDNLSCDLHIGMETGDIVGLTIHDENLIRIKQETNHETP